MLPQTATHPRPAAGEAGKKSRFESNTQFRGSPRTTIRGREAREIWHRSRRFARPWRFLVCPPEIARHATAVVAKIELKYQEFFIFTSSQFVGPGIEQQTWSRGRNVLRALADGLSRQELGEAAFQNVVACDIVSAPLPSQILHGLIQTR
jgi:hypothetical protein